VLQCILFLLQYWLSRSSKVNDFYFAWQGICHFLLLMIDSNLHLISQHFRSTIAWNFPSKIAAKSLQMEIWLVLAAYWKSPAPYLMVRLWTPFDLLFSHNTAQLAYYSALWPFKVIQSQWFLCNLKGHMPLC